ncbi:Gfo/Idh/MocA family protein [Rhodococcus sp. NPDC057297]|jgi:predicted dehydrogenase|uniref:Gfo/Idh/MocA family protein n=1 Tax=Rhodococcus sp. NPDC057297 TaxID=3346090 RepID=UPI003625A8E4
MNHAISTAFIGTGFMGRTHVQAARSAGARLSGIVGSSIESGAAAAERFGIDKAYPTLDAVLADDTIDVVHILTPNALHSDQAMSVVRAGKHVVCEKPLATDPAAALALATEAARAGVVNAVPFVYRFHPMVREARARITGNRVLTISGRYLQDWLTGTSDNWRVHSTSGGRSRAFADIGSHLVDALEFVTGRQIVRLAARTSIVEPTRGGRTVETEDAVTLIFEMDGGAIGSVLISQVSAGRKNQLAFEISTDTVTVAFDQEHPDDLWLGALDGGTTLPREPRLLSSDAARLSVVPAGHPLGYVDAFSAFVADVHRAIRGEGVEGLPTFQDGLRAVQLTDAVLDSAAGNRWIETSAAHLRAA